MWSPAYGAITCASNGATPSREWDVSRGFELLCTRLLRRAFGGGGKDLGDLLDDHRVVPTVRDEVWDGAGEPVHHPADSAGVDLDVCLALPYVDRDVDVLPPEVPRVDVEQNLVRRPTG